MTEGENIEPTPNYDCHISQAQAKPSDQLYLQLARSQVTMHQYVTIFTLHLAHMKVLFDLILCVPSTIFQLYRDGSSWVEPVLS